MISKKILKYIILVSLSILAGIFIGRFFPGNKNKVSDKKQDSFQIRAQGYTYINPLLDCDNYNHSAIRSLNKAKNELKVYIDSIFDGKNVLDISVYLRILNDGPWIGINENANYTPASLLKVPMMIACYKKAESEPDFLKKKIQYTHFNSTYVQTILDTNMLKVGEYYTIEKLIEKMVIFSDNASLELIADKIGDDFFFQVMDDNGVDIKNLATQNDYISVRQYSSFFRMLYNSTYLTKQYSERCLEILSKSHYPMGIPRFLPKDVLVSHKFGEVGTVDSYVKQLHDCGIVYRKNSPYLICIMTKGHDFNYLSERMADISKIIYKNLNE
ncbi:MAG: serine hydrolase [Saprospiraceae bacterium]